MLLRSDCNATRNEQKTFLLQHGRIRLPPNDVLLGMSMDQGPYSASAIGGRNDVILLHDLEERSHGMIVPSPGKCKFVDGRAVFSICRF